MAEPGLPGIAPENLEWDDLLGGPARPHEELVAQ